MFVGACDVFLLAFHAAVRLAVFGNQRLVFLFGHQTCLAQKVNSLVAEGADVGAVAEHHQVGIRYLDLVAFVVNDAVLGERRNDLRFLQALLLFRRFQRIPLGAIHPCLGQVAFDVNVFRWLGEIDLQFDAVVQLHIVAGIGVGDFATHQRLHVA